MFAIQESFNKMPPQPKKKNHWKLVSWWQQNSYCAFFFSFSLSLSPDGTFQLKSVTNPAFKRVREHVIRTPRKCHNYFLINLLDL